VSGTPIRRPAGQIKPPDLSHPVFSLSRKLDFELEMAYIIGQNSELGQSISTADAEEFVFGFMIFNDWSARDLQSWEYVPLGPFLGKNFGSSLSPWVVTLDALEPFRQAGVKKDPPVLPYLKDTRPFHFDINLEVLISSDTFTDHRICLSNYKYLYWSVSQQLAHHTVNGCNMRIGDLCASGTISGKERESWGSLLELSWNGKEPLTMPDGTTRTFLEDGDTITMKAWGEKNGVRIGFGEVTGQIIG
jgi:fumarylacetoacetase